MALDTSRIQALLFDVDGTLRDTDDAYVIRFTKLLSPLKPFLDPQTTARRIVMRMETPANFLISIPDFLTIDDEIAGFFDWLHEKNILRSRHKPFLIIPGVPEALAQLTPRFPSVVVSARDRRGTHAFMEQADLTGHFRFVVSGQTAHRTKPHPAPVHYAAEKLGISPQNCLMIGDTVVDIRSGRRAGAQTVGVLSGFGDERELTRAGADLIVDSIADLPALLP